MGLAASQARFLAITARKMNCEFQSMQIAQDKLSVTRDLQKASQDYQTSLNASKLVWESEDGRVYDLSYATMMTPSNLNDYSPYLITDTSGKIVLSESMFKAAQEAGIIDENGDPKGNLLSSNKTDLFTIDGRDAFLDKLGANNLAPVSTINSIKNLGLSGYSKSGVGGDILDKTTSNIMRTNTFLNYLKTADNVKVLSAGNASSVNIYSASGDIRYKANEIATSDVKYVTKTYKQGDIIDQPINNYTLADGTKQSFNKGDVAPEYMTVNVLSSASKATQLYPAFAGLGKDELAAKLSYSYTNKTAWGSIQAGQFGITDNSDSVVQTDLKDLNIVDILQGNYTILANMKNEEDKDLGFDKIVRQVIDMIAEVFGYDGAAVPSMKGLNTDSIANQALATAVQLTMDQFRPANYIDYKPTSTNTSKYNTVLRYVKSNNKWPIYGVSISNIANTFLTNFAIALDGTENEFYIDKETKKTTYALDDLNYFFEVANPDAPEQAMINADFYNQLYNNICMYGACTDTIKQQKITDNSYLANALKNGQLFISSLNTDGYFYAGHYTTNGHVGEIPDQDAITRAELEYEITKSKLNYKEETLELKMKNLDTEISALTTEFDTVKNLISKNVEKVFTMFSS